jgi:hypothetical protein
VILPWKRKEVFIGNSMTEFCKARNILSENHIEYDYRIVDRNSWQRSYGRTLAAGIGFSNEGQDVMYYVYVNTQDYETARYLLKK